MHELDVVSFIRMMKYVKVMMKALFSGPERYLIRKNRSLSLRKRNEEARKERKPFKTNRFLLFSRFL